MLFRSSARLWFRRRGSPTRGRLRSGGHRRRVPRSCVSLHRNSDVLSVGCQRALRGLKNLEHRHGGFAIRERLPPRLHGTQESHALVAKRFFRQKRATSLLGRKKFRKSSIDVHDAYIDERRCKEDSRRGSVSSNGAPGVPARPPKYKR